MTDATDSSKAQAIADRHKKGWRSTSDEVWGRPGICLDCGQAWPCDTAVVATGLAQARGEETPLIDPEYIRENFAGMHRHEDARRKFLDTIDDVTLARYVFDDIGVDAFDEAVASAAHRLGYTDPTDD